MFEIMALGRPMIVSVGGEAQRVIEQGNAGVCIEPEDTAALVEAITELKGDDERRQQLGERAKEYVWEEFSRPALSAKYLEVFEKVKSRTKKVRT
jgi:glycosyltransferase involved in cell wall biosynthesis